ncbi:MAG: tetratricopeptide repeat protein [Alphaproteobacteria bacterium]
MTGCKRIVLTALAAVLWGGGISAVLPMQISAEAKAEPTANELKIKAVQAGRKGKFSKALKYYERAAEMGDKAAQYETALLYWVHEGVSKDDTKARYWFEKSAVQGDVTSMINLGGMQETGRGGVLDYTSALYWYEKASSLGSDVARNYARNLNKKLDGHNAGRVKADGFYDAPKTTPRVAPQTPPKVSARTDGRKSYYELGESLKNPVPFDKAHVEYLDDACKRGDRMYEQNKTTFGSSFLLTVIADCSANLSELGYIEAKNTGFLNRPNDVTAILYRVHIANAKAANLHVIAFRYGALLNDGRQGKGQTNAILCNAFKRYLVHAKLSEVVMEGDMTLSGGVQGNIDAFCVPAFKTMSEQEFLYEMAKHLGEVSTGEGMNKRIARLLLGLEGTGYAPASALYRKP